MKVYDHDNLSWYEAENTVIPGAWQRHCGVLFSGDECPVCHKRGLYAAYCEVAFGPAAAEKKEGPVFEPAIIVDSVIESDTITVGEIETSALPVVEDAPRRGRPKKTEA